MQAFANSAQVTGAGSHCPTMFEPGSPTSKSSFLSAIRGPDAAIRLCFAGGSQLKFAVAAKHGVITFPSAELAVHS